MPIPATWVLCSLKPTGICSPDDGAGLSEAAAPAVIEPRPTARAKTAATSRRDLGRRNLTGLSKGHEGSEPRRDRRPPRRDGRSEGFDEAAVDDEVGAGDVRRRRTGEVEHEIGDLGRPGEAAGHRLASRAAGHLLGIDALGLADRGGDTAGALPQRRDRKSTRLN